MTIDYFSSNLYTKAMNYLKLNSQTKPTNIIFSRHPPKTITLGLQVFTNYAWLLHRLICLQHPAKIAAYQAQQQIEHLFSLYYFLPISLAGKARLNSTNQSKLMSQGSNFSVLYFQGFPPLSSWPIMMHPRRQRVPWEVTQVRPP